MNKTIFSTQEVAALLQISDARVRQLIAAGLAKPKQRLGNSWVFTKQEVKRLRTQRTAHK